MASQSQSQSRFKTSFEFHLSEDCEAGNNAEGSTKLGPTAGSKKRTASDLSQKTATPTSSKRKLSAPPPPRLPKPTLSTDTLWIDEYAPKTVNQLVVHSGKIKQVREWLSSTYKTKPFLVVTGPSGTGKLSTVLALAADLDLRVLEWVNPLFAGSNQASYSAAMDMDDDDRFASNSPSIIQSFLDFVSRGSRYSQANDLLLFRDYPIFSKSGIERTHAVLTSLLRSRSRIPRVVFLFTDFNLPEADSGQLGPPGRSASSNLECPSSRDLLPSACAHAIHTIAFNAVAPTLMKKALKRIVSERCLVSTTYLESVIQSSHGDLRAAINTLQFAHLSPITSAAPSSSTSAIKCTTEQSRSLFRAVGRCLHAQRLPPPAGYTRARLPPHLDLKWSCDPLEVDINTVLTNLAVSSDLFTMVLHANYPEHIRLLGAHVFVADAFVDADVLQRVGRGSGGGNLGMGSAAPDLVRAHALALAKGMCEDDLDLDLNAFMAVEAAGIDWDEFDMDEDDGQEQVKSSQAVNDLVLGVNWAEFDSHPNEPSGSLGVGGLPTPESHLSQQHQAIHLDSSPGAPSSSSPPFSSQDSQHHQPLTEVSSTPPTSQPSQSNQQPALPTTVPAAPPPAPTSSTKQTPSGNRFQALIGSDHWTARRAFMDRSASLLRLGLRPEEAPFSPVFSHPNRRGAKRLTESAAAGVASSEEAQGEAQAPRLMGALPEGKSARWYLCAARRGGVPPWVDAFLTDGGPGDKRWLRGLEYEAGEEEEEDEIEDV